MQKLSPYVPGKPVDELARELGIDPAAIVKLASNENPLGASPKALEAIRAELAELTRYPDGNGFELKRKLAERCAVDAAQVTLGNGSNDILDLVARAYLAPGLNAVFSEHAFAVYPIATQAVGAEGRAVKARAWGHDLEAMLAAIDGQTRVVFVANPNNPTGTWFGADALERFLAQVPAEVLVVLDEAYIEYAEEMSCPMAWTTWRGTPTCWSRGPSPRPMAWLRCGSATRFRARRWPMCSTACASRSMSIAWHWRLPARRWTTMTTWRRVAA